MLSIIIPVLNEAATIKKLLKHLSQNISGKFAIEIIVVDGGSNDGTVEKVKESIGFFKNKAASLQVVSSSRGRAIQMNKGARMANGLTYYFLHADSFPPKDFDRHIQIEIESSNPAGCFRTKFDSNHWWLVLAGWFTQLNWRICRGGDQSLFISKQLFTEIGGYKEDYIICEDNILINELYKRKKFVVIKEWLTTSARLYRQKGVWNLQYHFYMIYYKKWRGADAATLYKYYENNINSYRKEKAITLVLLNVIPEE